MKMAENPGNSNAPRTNNNRKNTNNNFFRMRHAFSRNRSTGPRERPVSFVIPQAPSNPLSASSSQNSSSGHSSESTNGSSVQRQSSTSFQINKKSGPYSGWQLYFPETEYKDDLPLLRKIRAFEQHIKTHHLFYKLNEIRQKLWFSLPLKRLNSDDEFCRSFPNFTSDLNSATNETLMCAGLAAHQCIQKDLPKNRYFINLMNYRTYLSLAHNSQVTS